MSDNVIVRVPEQQFIRGEDGYSPEVTIENIEHGHSVNITDREHPEGQTFNVMDGDSAYEQAVAGGYTGTEAQFNAELANFKTLSEQAADSASTAAGAAFRAQNYERHAEDAESAARSYAEIALIRMNSADASAQDAEAYAIGKRNGIDVGAGDPASNNNSKYYMELAAHCMAEASSSETAATSSERNARNYASSAQNYAGQATSSASDAATAKTAAETAQGLAESAQAAAETAQGAAEDAQEAAEAVLASIPADYTELSGDVDDLKSAFNADLVSTDWSPNITKGSYIGVSDGRVHSASKYARTSALWNGFGARKAIAVNDPTYEFCLALYDETGNLGGTGYLESLGYSTGIQYIPKTAAKIGVSFRRVNQDALTDEDITAISAALSAFAATDTTLSVAGAPADAKTTGDMLNTAAADAKAVGDAVSSEYVHDGDILRMSTTPEAIPVNENHMGYNEFISSTWNTLLPTGYQEGDAYNASTTKIHGVKVERASSWTSTPYGTNVDTYTIYRYIFTPQNGYDKTLFLTSGCHGNEAEAYWSLYRLVRMIYFEGHKYPTLRNLRDCRLIIIPSWNPWGFQHYRRYNAFESKNYQAWAWLMASNHEVTVNGTVYDISQVGEANVIWQTLQDYGDSINLWLDLHTDPYAGRDTTNVDIDDPRGITPPYGCYGFSAKDSRGYRQLFSVMYDFYNILKDEYQFTETWHPQPTNPGGSSFTGWMAQFGFPGGVVEVSTFMDGFPYASGSAGMMKLAQEYYGNCITEMLR